MKKTTFAKFMKELKLTWYAAAALTEKSPRTIGYLVKGTAKIKGLEDYGLRYLWECHLYGTEPKKFSDKNKN